MLRNNIKTAWRNLARNRMYAAINVLSIAIGLSAFWLIVLYVADEYSYDRNIPGADRIYRVAQHAVWDGSSMDIPLTAPPFAPAMKRTFPEIETATRIDMEGGGIIQYDNNKTTRQNDIIVADNQFFKVFAWDFIYGDKTTALSKPGSIVVTESFAAKLFGEASGALNKTIYFGENNPNTITGIIKDIPENTHLRFSAVRSSNAFNTDEWKNFYLYTYIILKKSADVGTLEKKLPQFAADNFLKDLEPKKYSMELQPLTAIHLHSNLQYELGTNGSINRVYMFSAIAVLILLIGLVNYMNITTARSSVRVKEVGIRKVVGSGRANLVKMIITEAMIVTFLAAALALFIVNAAIPFFNNLSGKNLTVWRFGFTGTLLGLVVFVILTGIISGIYPAFFLSRFKTIPALKGQIGNVQTNLFFRRSLVVFQFMITVVMIAGSIIIYQQLQYALNKDLGFNKEQTLSFHIDDMAVRQQAEALKTQLLKNPAIQSVAVAGNPIGNNDLGGHSYTFENDGAMSPNEQMAQELMVDEDFLPTIDLKLEQGRNFSAGMVTDKTGTILINETLKNKLGWKDAIGKKMQFRRTQFSEMETRTVIGVVKDFHTYSLQHAIEPLVIMMTASTEQKDNLYVRIARDKTAEGLAYIKQVYARFDRNNAPDLHFLDENFARQYSAEQKQEQISMVFTILAVVIACLGLFGLATFTATQRVKEIGIRKVLGAGVASVTFMLAKDFIKLVCFAIIIAIPVAWYAMDKWLQDFAYRINIEWWMFVLAGLIALLIAIGTVSFQAIKAAIANPVKALRSE